MEKPLIFVALGAKGFTLKNALILCCEQYTEALEETLESMAECDDIDDVDCYAIVTFDDDILLAIEPYEAMFNNVFVKDKGTSKEHREFAKMFEDIYDNVFIYFAGQHIPAEIIEEKE